MMDDLDDLLADNLLAGAKAAAMQSSDALMARVLADAVDVQAARVKIGRVLSLALPPRVGWFAGLAAVFGGVGSLVGVGSAAMVGLFFGLVQPDGMASVTDLWAVGTVDQVDLMPQLDVLLAEE